MHVELHQISLFLHMSHYREGEGVFILECFATAGLPLYKALGLGFPLTITSLTLSQCHGKKQENRANRIS